MTALLAEEVAANGDVRPPWIRFPRVHPFDIAWRMGAGETHVMLWFLSAEGRDAASRIAAIARYGAVPADRAWWAADAVDLIDADADIDLYEVPFDEVRAKLSAIGIAIDGSPSDG